jgi:beta-carotene hydroxylase
MEKSIASHFALRFNPTVALGFTGVVFFILNIAITLSLSQSPWVWAVAAVVFVVQVILVVVLFTPLHDAVHRCASKNKLINELVMQIVWPVYLNAPTIFRKIHLAHHARTNHPKLDPDHFTSAPSWTEKWIRSFILIFSYYGFSMKHFPRTPSNLFWMTVSALSLPAAITIAVLSPFTALLFAVWIVPAYVGIGILGFINTAWPHHPGNSQDRYKNTSIMMVPAPLKLLMLNQNLHLVHHLRPTIPWYQYEEFWEENKESLIASGANVRDYTHFSSKPKIHPSPSSTR